MNELTRVEKQLFTISPEKLRQEAPRVYAISQSTPEFIEKRDRAIANLIGSDIDIFDDKNKGKGFTGYDYGIMYGKKTLYEQGGIKLKNEFNLVPVYKHNLVSSNNSFAISVECTLYLDGFPLGQGLGGGAGSDDRGINKGIQMARKRSFVHAIRSVLMLGNTWTQDIEETVFEEVQTKREAEKISKMQWMLRYATLDKLYIKLMVNTIKDNELKFDITSVQDEKGSIKPQLLAIKLLSLGAVEFKTLWMQIPLVSRKEFKKKQEEQKGAEE